VVRAAHFVCVAHVEMELAEHKHVHYYDE
jgi:hypothetical protein